jgi:hypothetical protein
LTGTILQCCCVIIAIFYLARQFGLVIVPLAVAILVIHWSRGLGAPTSIWPPHVLFGPFVLLVVFAAGTAAGDNCALPVLIFAGGMLVHGHVAQPLLVAPIGGIAIALWSTEKYRKGQFRNATLSMALSAIIAFAFLVPIMLDVMKGQNSNLSAIIRHLNVSSNDHHNLRQGTGYFLSFFRYEHTQDSVQGAQDFCLHKYVFQHLSSWWAAIISSLCIVPFFLRSPPQGLGRRYALVICIAVILSILWGAFQDGGMYDFNGNFIYAVVYLLYLLPALLVADIIRKAPQTARIGLAVIATTVMIAVIPYRGKTPFMWEAPSDGLNVKLRDLTAGKASVQVTIDPDVWYAGFAVIVALDRLNVPFAVQPVGYAFLYGERGAPHFNRNQVVEIEVSKKPSSDGYRIPDAGMTPESAIIPPIYICRSASQ